MFKDMNADDAISLVQAIGLCEDALFLSLPVSAALAIQRCKRNNSSSILLLFPRLIFWGWWPALAAMLVYALSAYSENGPSPQDAAAESLKEIAGFALLVLAINVGLFIATRASPQRSGRRLR